MGTTAEKLTYLSGTKDKLKTAINYAGASITNDTFRSYPEKLYNAYIDIINQGTQELFDSLPKVTGTGTELTLNNTRKGKMVLDLKGNTYQDSTTGKNKLPYSLQSIKTTNTSGTWNNNVYTYNGVTFTINDDLSIKIGGTFNSRAFLYLQTAITEIGKNNYILNGCPSGGSDSSYRIVCGVQDGQGSSTSSKDYGSGVNINVSSYTQPMIRTYVDIQSSAGIGKTFYPMLRLSSVVDDTYEPYTNGPSPNPDYPQEIHNVSGDNTIEICGKNLLNYNDLTTQATNVGIAINSNDEVYDTSPTGDNRGWGYNASNWKMTLPSGTYTLSLYFSTQTTSNSCGCIIYNSSNEGIIGSAGNIKNLNSKTLTFTLEETTDIGIMVKQYESVYKIQLEKGSTATSYVEHKEQNYPINLLDGTTPIELCKIGDYQDYIYKEDDKWYLHKEIGKVVLDGTEDIRQVNATRYRVIISNIIKEDNANVVVIGKYFNGVSYNDRKNTGEITFYSNNSLYLQSSTFSTLEDTKTWITNNKPPFYYALATPTDTEITDTTLLEQLETIKKSYDEQTNISQNNTDLPFVIKASAIKEYE